MYQGKTIQVNMLDTEAGIVELFFDRENDSINKLDKLTVSELGQALETIKQHPAVKGALISSAKPVFIVGADITEFTEMFRLNEREIIDDVTASNQIFNALQDLPVPTVTLINGFALGGGLECALATDFRVQSDQAKIGLPEVHLGLIPGFGGTVRLARVSGVATAAHLISTGVQLSAEQALQAGIVDAIADADQLRDTGLNLLKSAIQGQLDWQTKRQIKTVEVASDLRLSDEEINSLIEKIKLKSDPRLTANLNGIQLLRDAMPLDATQALQLETQTFAQIAKTQAAASLVQKFLNDQSLKKRLKPYLKDPKRVAQVAVVGTGIMGAGISFANIRQGIGVIAQDVQQQALNRCEDEIERLIAQALKKGRLNAEQAEQYKARVKLQQDYTGFAHNQITIEAVTEKSDLKAHVLKHLESQVTNESVIATNTSSLRLQDLQQHLKHRERFVGLHFFNPVPVMPLVEVIKSEYTSSQTIEHAVQYVTQLKKTPIVVQDCSGFLVNRILTPYINAFYKLISEGVEIDRIDRVAEAYGWSMGPGYLQDVVGLDTAAKVFRVISGAYPERMQTQGADMLDILVSHQLFGQKNGQGFYVYDAQQKRLNPQIQPLLSVVSAHTKMNHQAISDEEIIQRLMLPMLIEAAICLQEGVVENAFEVDIAVNLGLGFPAYLGGPIKNIDWIGADQIIAQAEKYQLSQFIPENILLNAAQGRHFYA